MKRTLYWSGVALGGILLAVQLATGMESLVRLNLSRAVVPMTVATSLGVVSIALQVLSWRQIMAVLGVGIPARVAFSGYSISFLARYIPGSFWGYLGRAEWLRHEMKVKVAITHLGSVMETGVIVTANLALVGGLVWLRSDNETAHRLWLGILVLVGLGWVASVWFLKRRLKDTGPIPKQQMVSLSARLASSASLSIMLWIASGAVLSAIAWAFRPSSSQALSISLDLLQAYCIAWLVGFAVPAVPSGLGLRESALTLLLHLQMGFPTGEASAISLLARLALVLAEILMAGLGVAITRLGPNQERETTQ